MLEGKAVTYTEMCSGLHDQGLAKDQLEAHWGNLKKVLSIRSTQERNVRAMLAFCGPFDRFEYVFDSIQFRFMHPGG